MQTNTKATESVAPNQQQNQEQSKGLLQGKLMLVARQVVPIKSKNGEEDSSFLRLILTNGVMSFEVTSGNKAPFSDIPMLTNYIFNFDIDNSKGFNKLRCVSIEGLTISERTK